MKVATVSAAGERCVGQIAKEGTSIALFDLALSEAQDGVLALIRRNGVMSPTLSPIPLCQGTIEAPIPLPRCNIFCVGKNYYEHAHEFARCGFDTGSANGAVPGTPIMFSKVPESVFACGGVVVTDPRVSKAVDYEAELTVIVGKAGRGIDAKNAFNHVWGYTVINDVTVRDLQARYSQWLIGKSQDTLCPRDPFAVTRDEIDIGNTPIKCCVNGELRQSSNTGLLIATETPADVGSGSDPPQYLEGGDVARIEIGSIGILDSEIVERTT